MIDDQRLEPPVNCDTESDGKIDKVWQKNDSLTAQTTVSSVIPPADPSKCLNCSRYTRSGRFVACPARCYGSYGNKLGISDKDVPLNYRVDATEKIIAPPFRGGALVSFPVQGIQRILGQITLDDGVNATVPAYGELSLIANGKLFESPIGRQGEFYLENLPAGRYSAKVEHKEGSCTVTLDVPELDQSEIKLGTLKCQLH